MPKKGNKTSYTISGNGVLHVRSSEILKSTKFQEQVKTVQLHTKNGK